MNPDKTAPLGYLSREHKQMREADNKSHGWQETGYRSKKSITPLYCWVQALIEMLFHFEEIFGIGPISLVRITTILKQIICQAKST